MSNTVRSVRNMWSKLINQNKDLRSISKVHIDLIERLEKHPPLVSGLGLSKEQIKEKLDQGIPYLEGEEDKVELNQAILHFRELCDWLGLGDARAMFRKMKKKATDEEVQRLLRAWLKGDSQTIDTLASTYELPLDILYIVLRYTLLPTLYQYVQEFEQQKVFDNEEWMKDYCPVCGDQHGLAEFRGGERFRHLRCLSCAGDWVFWRIGCPHCHNRDHNSLSAIMIEEGNNKYQIDLCDQCKGYVKGTNKLDKSSPAFLLLDDFATFHLDHLAMEKGYHRANGLTQHEN